MLVQAAPIPSTPMLEVSQALVPDDTPALYQRDEDQLSARVSAVAMASLTDNFELMARIHSNVPPASSESIGILEGTAVELTTALKLCPLGAHGSVSLASTQLHHYPASR